MANEFKKNQIKTHGWELALIGIIGFAALIGSMLAAYHLFIVGRVKTSEEFRVASYFAVNSYSLREKLGGTVSELQFKDIDVDESGGFGVCEIYFKVRLTGGKKRNLGVGLVKVADYWIVYEAALDPLSESRREEIASTYQGILLFLEKIDYQEYAEADALLKTIRSEMRQPDLEDLLAAKLNVGNGNTEYALQLLNDLAGRARYSKAAVLYEQALVYFNRQDYAQAVSILEKIETEATAFDPKPKPSSESADEESETSSEDDAEDEVDESIFGNMPKDPFIASIDPRNVLASSRKLMSLAYNYAGDYQKGLDWAVKAIKQADKIKSAVIRSSAVYLKALNLYSLGRYDDADTAFADVISDLDNPNLSQKAWSCYFRADIAARGNNPEAGLDYYEMAVNFDPSNAMIRQGAITYLAERNYIGDLEIALGLALRGIDYGVEKDTFKTSAADLYRRLGLPDRTQQMN